VNGKGKNGRERIKAALAVLRELGGAAGFREEENMIRGTRCPLAAITADHPEACLIAESLLSRIIGRPVKEHCVHRPAPSCRFQVKQESASIILAGQGVSLRRRRK
jgi:hypothetical protein